MSEVSVASALVFSVRRIVNTNTGCDQCSRSARYIATAMDEEMYLCHSHAVRLIKRELVAISSMRYGA